MIYYDCTSCTMFCQNTSFNSQWDPVAPSIWNPPSKIIQDHHLQAYPRWGQRVYPWAPWSAAFPHKRSKHLRVDLQRMKGVRGAKLWLMNSYTFRFRFAQHCMTWHRKALNWIDVCLSTVAPNHTHSVHYIYGVSRFVLSNPCALGHPILFYPIISNLAWPHLILSNILISGCSNLI